MNCRFCDEEIKLPPVCDKCQQLYFSISDTKHSIVEQIIREISVRKFMKEKRDKGRL